jgi:diacylglycerol kinase (ATP)
MVARNSPSAPEQLLPPLHGFLRTTARHHQSCKESSFVMTEPFSEKRPMPSGLGATANRDPGSGPGGSSPSARFDRVVVIFNPNSTRDAAGLARRFRRDLVERFPGLEVALRPTERAGHAADLAREAARQGRPLVVSVSGDGGYNEVVNGLVQAGNRQATSAVMPAGNANDHSRVTQERPLVDAVVAGDIARMDLLRLTITASQGEGFTHTRYAHSYIGVGFTPLVAADLEKGGKGSLREVVSVVRTFSRFQPFEIQLPEGNPIRVVSLLFANISRMAKVAKLSENGNPDDGRFEVLTILHQPKWRILVTALKAATVGLGRQPTARQYRFTAVQPMPLQVDGEVVNASHGDRIQVEIAPAALATIR